MKGSALRRRRAPAGARLILLFIEECSILRKLSAPVGALLVLIFAVQGSVLRCDSRVCGVCIFQLMNCSLIFAR
jgi:CBS-domain-containing membrane protein